MLVAAATSLIGNLVAHRRRTAAFEQHLQLHRLYAELGVLSERLAEAVLTDGLTGVGNRRRLDADAARLATEVARYGRSGSGLLVASVRAVDSVCRAGGEEFALLLPEQDAGGAAAAAERLRAAVEAAGMPRRANPPWGVVTISVGVAVIEAGTDPDLAGAFRAADRALYQAKAGGRNRVARAEAAPRGDGIAAT